jgi:hypothetical protein
MGSSSKTRGVREDLQRESEVAFRVAVIALRVYIIRRSLSMKDKLVPSSHILLKTADP